MSKTLKIKTNLQEDKFIPVDLNQTFDHLKILSLTVAEEDLYNPAIADTGVVIGRVIANDGIGVPNVKVSIFIPLDEDDEKIPRVRDIYPFKDVDTKYKINDRLERYNLLSDKKVKEKCDQPIGTLPNKRKILEDETLSYIYEKYYKFTTRTNESGDFILTGVPTGNQVLHIDSDMGDIGYLSVRPFDLIDKGYSKDIFKSETLYATDKSLSELPQVVTKNIPIDVIPFYSLEETVESGITRVDIDYGVTLPSNAVFFGNIFSDSKKNSINKNGRPRRKLGNQKQLISTTGTVEVLKRLNNGSVDIVDQIDIDEDGNWAALIPMNLNRMVTSENGGLVQSPDPNKGIPMEAEVRFRITPSNENVGRVRRRASLLVPNMYNNFHFIPYDSDQPNFVPRANVTNNDIETDSYVDYSDIDNTEYGVYPTIEASNDAVPVKGGADPKDTDNRLRDFYRMRKNKIYTVRQYIPRIQHNDRFNNRNFLGLKNVVEDETKTPLPFNRFDRDFNPLYSIICLILSLLTFVAATINTIIMIVNRIFTLLCDIKLPCGFAFSGGKIKVKWKCILANSICNDLLKNQCLSANCCNSACDPNAECECQELPFNYETSGLPPSPDTLPNNELPENYNLFIDDSQVLIANTPHYHLYDDDIISPVLPFAGNTPSIDVKAYLNSNKDFTISSVKVNSTDGSIPNEYPFNIVLNDNIDDIENLKRALKIDTVNNIVVLREGVVNTNIPANINTGGTITHTVTNNGLTSTQEITVDSISPDSIIADFTISKVDVNTYILNPDISVLANNSYTYDWEIFEEDTGNSISIDDSSDQVFIYTHNLVTAYKKIKIVLSITDNTNTSIISRTINLLDNTSTPYDIHDDITLPFAALSVEKDINGVNYITNDFSKTMFLTDVNGIIQTTKELTDFTSTGSFDLTHGSGNEVYTYTLNRVIDFSGNNNVIGDIPIPPVLNTVSFTGVSNSLKIGTFNNTDNDSNADQDFSEVLENDKCCTSCCAILPYLALKCGDDLEVRPTLDLGFIDKCYETPICIGGADGGCISAEEYQEAIDGGKIVTPCKSNFQLGDGCGPGFIDEASSPCTEAFLDCQKNKLLDIFNVLELDFYNDWLNGSLYLPMFKYKSKIKKRRKLVFEKFSDFDYIAKNGNNDNVDTFNQTLLHRMNDEAITDPNNPKKDIHFKNGRGDRDMVSVDQDTLFTLDTTDVCSRCDELYSVNSENNAVDHPFNDQVVKINNDSKSNELGSGDGDNDNGFGYIKEFTDLDGEYRLYYPALIRNAKNQSNIKTNFKKEENYMLATDITELGSYFDCDIDGTPYIIDKIDKTSNKFEDNYENIVCFTCFRVNSVDVNAMLKLNQVGTNTVKDADVESSDTTYDCATGKVKPVNDAEYFELDPEVRGFLCSRFSAHPYHYANPEVYDDIFNNTNNYSEYGVYSPDSDEIENGLPLGSSKNDYFFNHDDVNDEDDTILYTDSCGPYYFEAKDCVDYNNGNTPVGYGLTGKYFVETSPGRGCNKLQEQTPYYFYFGLNPKKTALDLAFKKYFKDCRYNSTIDYI